MSPDNRHNFIGGSADLKLLKWTAVILPLLLIAMILLANLSGSPPNPGGKARNFEVEQGDTGASVALKLREAGLIRSPGYFMMLMRFRKGAILHAGEYRLSPSMSAQDVLNTLIGETGGEVERRVTIPEGFTAQEVAERLDSDGFCPEDEFIDIVSDPEGQGIDTHGLSLDSLEGFLYPETYFFAGGVSCKAIAQKMVDQFFEEFTPGDITAARTEGYSPLEIVTLASMIEAEAKHENEREIISGVMRNRLRANMRLQIDATVQYALPEHKERLLNKDLEVDSPYNTYKNDGLPPGPICNPGLPSLEAALRPADVPYYYYVARADGSHIFSRNSDGHARAIQEARRTWRR